MPAYLHAKLRWRTCFRMFVSMLMYISIQLNAPLCKVQSRRAASMT